MTQNIMLSGLNEEFLKDSLTTALKATKPRFIGIASAFVSVSGVKIIDGILTRCGSPQCRLIAGIDKAITHPEALYIARKLGWEIRLGKAQRGIFHPKLLVAGQEISPSGLIGQLSFVYIGSSNLTAGGLKNNVECGLLAEKQGCPESAPCVFSQLWESAHPATDDAIRNYSARFAEIARRRKVSELDDLGVSDSEKLPASPSELQEVKTPAQPAIAVSFATAAWAGVQSFTGEYRFQIEFPRAAGIVISQLLRLNKTQGAHTKVYCPDDESTWGMHYKFYHNNGMFRLNIPNAFPGVAWVRKNREGIVLVESGPSGGAPLRLQFHQPGVDANEAVKRSAALGTWGKTNTRLYGWY